MEILPRHYIIGIIMFAFIIVGGISILDSFQSTDPTFIDTQKYQKFNNTFNVYNDITEEVDTLENNIAESDTDFGSLGVLSALLASGWNTLKLLFSSFGFMEDVFLGTHYVFGVPLWVGTLVISLITVIIAFAIYTAVFQREI